MTPQTGYCISLQQSGLAPLPPPLAPRPLSPFSSPTRNRDSWSCLGSPGRIQTVQLARTRGVALYRRHSAAYTAETETSGTRRRKHRRPASHALGILKATSRLEYMRSGQSFRHYVKVRQLTAGPVPVYPTGSVAFRYSTQVEGSRQTCAWRGLAIYIPTSIFVPSFPPF